MENAKPGTDFVSAPKDYADLFRLYYPYVVALVKRSGIEENRKEDVASEILLRFYERGFLTKFDPNLTFEYDGKQRSARFKSFLSYFVLTYVKGHRDKQTRLNDRELLIMNSPAVQAEHIYAHHNRTAMTSVHEEEILEVLQEQALIAHLRAHLATVPKRSKKDPCDLVRLFDLLVDQVHRTDRVCLRELREVFGISATGMSGWMWHLRGSIAEYLGRPLPAKRIRRSTI